MRRSVIAASLAALVVLLLAPPVAAKGPSSVLITNPGRGTAVGVTGADGRLMELYNLVAAGTDLPGPPRGVPARSRISLVWIAGDCCMLGVHQVVLDGAGGVLVATQSDEFSARTTWRKVADPGRLRALLTDLDVLGPTRTADGIGQDAAASGVPTGPREPERAAAGEPELRWFSLAGWRWVLPGLGLGLLAGAVATCGALRRQASLRG